MLACPAECAHILIRLCRRQLISAILTTADVAAMARLLTVLIFKDPTKMVQRWGQRVEQETVRARKEQKDGPRCHDEECGYDALPL